MKLLRECTNVVGINSTPIGVFNRIYKCPMNHQRQIWTEWYLKQVQIYANNGSLSRCRYPSTMHSHRLPKYKTKQTDRQINAITTRTSRSRSNCIDRLLIASVCNDKRIRLLLSSIQRFQKFTKTLNKREKFQLLGEGSLALCVFTVTFIT